MARDHIDLGPVPCDEECEQIGPKQPEVHTMETQSKITPSTPAASTITLYNGIYTIVSPPARAAETGITHRTFRIKTSQRGNLKGRRIVSLLTGPNNEADYEAFAFVEPWGISVWKSHRGEGLRTNWAAYARMLAQLAGEDPREPLRRAGYKLEIARTCMRCNRLLTTSASISLGIGPECATRG